MRNMQNACEHVDGFVERVAFGYSVPSIDFFISILRLLFSPLVDHYAFV